MQPRCFIVMRNISSGLETGYQFMQFGLKKGLENIAFSGLK